MAAGGANFACWDEALERVLHLDENREKCVIIWRTQEAVSQKYWDGQQIVVKTFCCSDLEIP